MYLCKFGQNPPTGSENSVLERLILQPWKLGQVHQNLVNALLCYNDKIYNVDQNPSLRSRHNVQELFYVLLYVTLCSF